MSISLEDAKALMTPDKLEKLKDVVTVKPTINMDKKTANDILMQALCKAVSENVIHETSLNGKIVKLLNAETNSISQSKLGEILTCVRKHQPNMACYVSLLTGDMSKTINEWIYIGPDVSFNEMFEYIIDAFNITPGTVREKLSRLLKPTIANNIAQFLSKYEMESDKSEIPISITTITRLVNMENYLLMAEFKDM